MYGQRKAIAKRVPVTSKPRLSTSAINALEEESTEDLDDLSTPAATEGETATETELETESDSELEDEPLTGEGMLPRKQEVVSTATKSKRAISQHDLMNIYFRRDTIFLNLKNIDLFRSAMCYLECEGRGLQFLAQVK
jgi:phosphatidylethanolamine N-methyltransferase